MYFFIVLIFWILLSACVPSSAYWRDSAEFIISANYLDIPHPAGFPFYSQLANIFSLLPVGPIAFRVNLFSAFVSLMFLLLLSRVAFELLTKEFDVAAKSGRLLSLICSTAVLLFPAFWRQSLTAEVYMLHSLVALLLVALFLRYVYTKDARFLLLASFLSGLGVGNHVFLMVVLVSWLLLLILIGKPLRAVWLPGFFFFCFGLLVYSYIPVRACSHPPLNTGEGISVVRLQRILINKRDVLRPEVSKRTGVDEGLFNDMQIDLSKLAKQSSWGFVAVSGLGLLVFAVLRPVVGLVFVLGTFSTWICFKRWDPDPWIFIIASLSLGFTLVVSFFLTRFQSRFLAGFLKSLLLVVMVYSMPVREALSYRTFDDVVGVVERKLMFQKFNSVFLTEPSWFFLKYLRDIEGLREDVVLVYEPSIFFPALFVGTHLKSNSSSWTSLPGKEPSDELLKEMSIQNFKSLTQFLIANRAEFAFEPALSINPLLAGLARYEAGVVPQIVKNKTAFLSNLSMKALLGSTQEMRDKLFDRSAIGWADYRNYAEIITFLHADLLDRMGHADKAQALLKILCLPIDNSNCSKELLRSVSQ